MVEMDHLDMWSYCTWWNILVAIVVIYFTYDGWCHTLFWRSGIKGPLPKPIIGNMLDVSKGLQNTHMEWIKKYGRIVGAYESQTPYLVVAEPEILQKILQEDFKKFSSRRVYELKSCPFDKSLSQQTDPNEWYQTRQMMTSLFSDDSLRWMFENMNDTCSTLVKNMQTADDSKPMQMKRFFDAFSMDMIGKSAFGLHLDSFTNSDRQFIHQGNRILQSGAFSRTLLVASSLPWITPVFNFFRVGLFPADAIQFFRKTVFESLQSMLQVSSAELQKQTLLNGMMESRKSTLQHIDADNLTAKDALNCNNNKSLHGLVEVKIDDPEIDDFTGQTLDFLLAGNETISTALCLTSYAIAAHSNVQERLLEEIDRLLPNSNSAITYDVVANMTYLDMVVKESLRIYPPTVVFDRVCNETVRYGSITIPAGMAVMVPIWALHRDSKYWTNPHRFNPQRFKKQIHPFSYLPFGSGPRNCIAMDFAILQIKLVLLRILRLYRLVTCSETESPPILGSAGLLTPPNGIILKLVPRGSNIQL